MQVFKASYEDEFLEESVETSTVLRIQTLEMSLERAVGDIGLLQQNLGYMIRVKEQLQSELRVRDQKERCLVQECQKQLVKKDRELQRLRLQQDEFSDLLTDIKGSLNVRETNLMQKEDEVRRLNRIMQDQKATIQMLQGEVLAVRYGADLSYQSINEENQRLEQLEKLNEVLRFEAQKGKGLLEKEMARNKKLEREVEQFKSWLAGVVGVRKVVEGCETVLMEEIATRLQNCAKYQFE